MTQSSTSISVLCGDLAMCGTVVWQDELVSPYLCSFLGCGRIAWRGSGVHAAILFIMCLMRTCVTRCALDRDWVVNLMSRVRDLQ